MSYNARRFTEPRENPRAARRKARQQEEQEARTETAIRHLMEEIVRALHKIPAPHCLHEDSRDALYMTLAQRSGISLRTQAADRAKGRQLRTQGDHYREFTMALQALIDAGRVALTVEDKFTPLGPCAITLALTRDEMIDQLVFEAWNLPLPEDQDGVIFDGDIVNLTSHQTHLLGNH